MRHMSINVEVIRNGVSDLTPDLLNQNQHLNKVSELCILKILEVQNW